MGISIIYQISDVLEKYNAVISDNLPIMLQNKYILYLFLKSYVLYLYKRMVLR